MTNAAKRCADILARSFPEGGSWSETEIAAVLSRPGGHLFENAGGFTIINAVLDEAEIWTISVAPERRRQGYAAALLAEARETLAHAGIAKLYLEVAEDNIPARALYTAQGFVETGRRKAYYRNADGTRADAILMTLELSA